jgi:aminopeptidase YwaD
VKKKYILLVFVFVSGFVQAQKQKNQDKQLVANVQQHIRFLSDDKLEGRRTGTSGEKLAAEYISSEFSKIGLTPKGTENYYQSFTVDEGKQINPTSFLTIDGQNLQLNRDYFPLSNSPSLTLEALPSLALREAGMPWFYDLKELLEENESNPHFDLRANIARSVKQVKEKGGTAVFLYNTSTKKDGLAFDGKDRSDLLPLPVIYLTSEAVKKYLVDEGATLDIKLRTDIGEKKRTGINVIGYLDQGAPTTIVLGAHFDHLGYGEDGNSRETGKREIHNGADDNASGTAALIELARLLKESKLKNNNYLFIAFSGEELGLYGSKYFTEHPTVDLTAVNFMINMDMIGRLNDSSKTITVGGFGTSPSWGEWYSVRGKKKMFTGDLALRFDSSGTGPSDHTSFYRKNIPVLFYFTGLHSDYHKPGDDFEKINYTGEAQVIRHIFSLIETSDKHKSRLAFAKTREAQTTTSTRFNVTLGVMPDYTFSGQGLRIDGVSENRPGQKAGLKAGDVITDIGPHKISSMEAYMQVLGKFKKGDKTTINYLREGKPLSSTVEF